MSRNIDDISSYVGHARYDIRLRQSVKGKIVEKSVVSMIYRL